MFTLLLRDETRPTARRTNEIIKRYMKAYCSVNFHGNFSEIGLPVRFASANALGTSLMLP